MRQVSHYEILGEIGAGGILPFRSLGDDADSSFLAQMLPDSISAELSRVNGVQVRSSLIGARYGPSPTDLRAIAAEAEVDFIVIGNLMRSEEQVRVSAQLLRVPAGTIAATVNLRARMDHLFDLQDQALREIMNALDRHFGCTTRADSNPDIPQTGPGWELYLRANLAAIDRRRLPEARHLYERSLSIDPNYAPGDWEGRAGCWLSTSRSPLKTCAARTMPWIALLH